MCVTNRCELTTWEHLLLLQSVYQGWIPQMQREEGWNLLKTIIIFIVAPVRSQWVAAMLGQSLGKDSPFTHPPPPYEKSRKRLPAHPFPLTSEVVAIEPKDPLGQLVIGSNVCTVTREILVCLWMWSSTLLYSIYNTTDNLL